MKRNPKRPNARHIIIKMAKNIPSNENQRTATKATLPSRLSIKIEGKIKSSPDKRNLKEYTSSKPALQEMLN